MLGAEAGHVSEPKKKKVIVVKSKNVLSEAQKEEPIAKYNPYRQNYSNSDNENHQEDKGDETCGEPKEDVMDEEPEEDPEEEIYEEYDEDPEKEIYEEREEDPEKEIYEEPEEDPEEEIYEKREEDPEKEIYEEPEEDPEEEIYKEPEEDPEAEEIDGANEEYPEEEIVEDPEEESEEEINEESDREELSKKYSHASSATRGGIASQDFGNELNKDPEEERGKEVVEAKTETITKQQEHGRSPGKQRHSRWDLKQEGETPNKRWKTRWDNNDTQNGSFNSSGIINFLEISTDPKITSLKVNLMEINKKLKNTRNAKILEKLMNKRKLIICQLAKTNLEPTRLVKKLFVPEKEYPTYNFIGLILGPKGITQKKMEKETGAKIFLRGKGSGEPGPSEDEDLHVQVEAYNQQALDAAGAMIEKLLIPVADENNDHKRAQLVELAKQRGTYKDHNICDLCKEQGHRTYACPLQDSTFKAVCCDICGSFGHSTSNCSISKTLGSSAVVIDHGDLYIGYLPYYIDEQRLKEMFLPFGKIIKTTVIKDQTTGLSKGYGFIKFENPLDAAAAITYMNGHQMEGKMLAVRLAGKKSVPAPFCSGHVPVQSFHTAIPLNILGQASSIYGPAVSMLPEFPFPSAKNESLSFPSSSSYSGPYSCVARTETPNIPHVVSTTTDQRATSNLSSSYDFCAKIPTSLPNSESPFPGHPGYPGLQFKSHSTNPAMNGIPNQMPETDKMSSFSFASHFPR